MSQFNNLTYDVSKLSNPSWTPTRTELRDPAKLAASLGITYDYDSIYNKFNDATRTEYDSLRKEQQASENKYYNDTYNSQMSSLDTIKKANAQSVATGASKGLQAANELSSILGLQQEAVSGATDLATARSTLADKEANAYAQNAVNALQQANSTALSLGTLNSNLYSADVQFDVGQMDYYATLDSALKSLMGMQEQANGNRYAADRNYDASVYTADKNYAAALASAANYASGGGYSSGGSSSDTTDSKLSYEDTIMKYMANGMNYDTAYQFYRANNGLNAGTPTGKNNNVVDTNGKVTNSNYTKPSTSSNINKTVSNISNALGNIITSSNMVTGPIKAISNLGNKTGWF